MCRASTASSRRNRSSILPANDSDARKAGKDANHDPLHEAPRRPVVVGGNVLDDYNVLPEELGRGHYGRVHECLHRATGKAYACKSIDKSRIKRLDHLRNEVELMSEIDHPGIVRMEDCYEDRDYVHIITEKYTGGELFDRIIERTTDKGCFSEERAAAVVKSLVEAVAYLHERDIVHRDLKPENILFESEDEKGVRIIDFGLSRRHKKGDDPMSNPVGTAYYMAPELLYGCYDRACDMWSVGAIAYILLCGFPPFNGDTDPEIFKAIKKGRFEFPARQWAKKSNEAKDLIRCLLRMDPRKRFTAEEALRHPWIRNLGKKPMDPRKRFTAEEALRHSWIRNLGKTPTRRVRRRHSVQSVQSALRSFLALIEYP